MIQDETIELARKAGFRVGPSRDGPDDVWGVGANLEAFAKLVAEKEREQILFALKEVRGRSQEPVAWISTGPARMIHWTADKPAYGDDWVPLYTTPPQSAWVGLTDEEAMEMYLDCGGVSELFDAIEAKLKDKNT